MGGRGRAASRGGNCPNPAAQTTVVRPPAPSRRGRGGAIPRLVAALLLLAAAAGGPGDARADWHDGGPPEGRLDYAISRGGTAVGKQSVEFIHNADGFIVRTHIRLTVTFLSMTIYRFEHDAVETWAMGRLTNFVSHSNDDGKSRDVEMAAEGDRLVGIYNGKTADVPGDIIPASLWHPGTVSASRLLDPIKGRERQVQVADHGAEEITLGGGPVMTQRYSMTGDIERELWYDAEGKLVQVAFEAGDGSEITLTLK